MSIMPLHYGVTSTGGACSYSDTPKQVYFLSVLSLSDVKIYSGFIGLGPFRLWRLAHRVGGWRGTFWKIQRNDR